MVKRMVMVCLMMLAAGCGSSEEDNNAYCLELNGLPESPTILSCDARDPFQNDPDTGQPAVVNCRAGSGTNPIKQNTDGLSGCPVWIWCDSPDGLDGCEEGEPVTVECAFAVCVDNIVYRQSP